MEQSEEWLSRTVTRLAETLTSDLDGMDYLATVVECGREIVDGAPVGILLSDSGGLLTVVAAAPDHVRIVELLELQNREGPGLECFRRGEQVVNTVFDEVACSRWRAFSPHALQEGFRAVHALPLRVPEIVLGVLTILDTHARQLSPREVGMAQSLAHLATVGVIRQRYARRPTHIANQLRATIYARLVIDQAKGIVARRLAIDVDAASALMRTYGRAHGVPLGELAHDIVRARTAPEALRLQAVTPGAA